jgi:acyl dehydratase
MEFFTTVTGDFNPMHVDPAFSAMDTFRQFIIQGMGAGLMSAALGTKLPGPGAIYLLLNLRFTHPVCIGATVGGRLRPRPGSEDTDWTRDTKAFPP